MEIIFNGFKEMNIELLRTPFEDLVSKLKQGLELESLKYIIIPEDFKTELHKFQNSKGLCEESTENELGEAGSKVVSYIEAGELEICIFLHSAVFGLLFSETSDDVLYSIQIINHELCHVHDICLKSKVLYSDFIAGQEGNYEWVLRLHADSIWSEYIANKLSKRRVDIGGEEIYLPTQTSLEIGLDLFLKSIPKAEIDAQNCIKEYRAHGDIEKLSLGIQGSAGFLLSMMGRTYGLLCPYNELVEKIDECLKDTYAFEIWKSLCHSLDALYSNYPRWDGVQDFDGLAQTVLKTWNILGVTARVTDEGLYINVPTP